MDFLKAIEEVKAKEQQLLNEKNQMKKQAVAQVKDLVKLFGITPSEIFPGASSKAKPATKDVQVDDELDYTGFEAGKTYTNGKKNHVFGARGKRPQWLKDEVRAGKTAKELLKKGSK
jgi:DNA-binding protein H-NS